MNNLEASSRILQEVCDSIKTAIEQGRTDVINSALEACKIIFSSFGICVRYSCRFNRRAGLRTHT